MSISAGLAAFKLSFELSPIILTGGVAALIPGGMLPIIAITEALNFADGLLSGGEDLGLDDFFASFIPLPGSTLIDQRIGEYPFANQAVAANAVIAQPLTISYRMICPAKDEFGYATKLATIAALATTLKQHNASGGTYTCATPAYFYTNCVMLGMRDTSNVESKQAQNTYQLDFRQPLLTLQDALQAQNGLFAQITSGTPINGVPSVYGLAQAIGNPATLAAVNVVPGSTGSAGAGVSSSFAMSSAGP